MASRGISGQLSQFPVESSVDPCTVCLGELEDRSLPNNCFHEFCFSCLLQWSKVKPKCPLCVQPFGSIIHNIKSDHEYDEQKIEMVDLEYDSSEYDEPDDYSLNFTQYTSGSVEEILNSEQQISRSRVDVSHAPVRVYLVVGEELREITHTNSDASISWPAITEPSTEDNLSPLHTIFTQQLVSSEQSLENLDTFPSSFQSDLSASHDSGSSLPPRPSRIGRVSLAIDEGERSVDPAPPGRFTGTVQRLQHCEISYGSWLPYPRPSEEEEDCVESEEVEEGVNFESEIDPDL